MAFSLASVVPGFLFAPVFFCVFLCAVAGRDVATLAALGRVQGRRAGVLATAVTCGVLTALAVAGAAILLAGGLDRSGRVVLAGIAAVLAGMELLFVPLPHPLREPTHSLGALAIVLASRQLTGAARIMVWALVLAGGGDMALCLAGAAATVCALVSVWRWPERFTPERLRVARRLASLIVIPVGPVLALWAVKFM